MGWLPDGSGFGVKKDEIVHVIGLVQLVCWSHLLIDAVYTYRFTFFPSSIRSKIEMISSSLILLSF
jgi:hypothetical protein